MNTRKAPIDLGPGLTPREAAADALYRLVHALDFNNEDLLRSAFTQDAVFDISGLSPASGRDYPPQIGPDAMVAGVLAHVGPMATSHNISNVRVKLNDAMDQAEVMCYVIAQHFRPGEGLDMSKRDCMLYGNSYWADVIKGEGGLWRMRRFEIQVMWAEGDMGVADTKTWGRV